MKQSLTVLTLLFAATTTASTITSPTPLRHETKSIYPHAGMEIHAVETEVQSANAPESSGNCRVQCNLSFDPEIFYSGNINIVGENFIQEDLTIDPEKGYAEANIEPGKYDFVAVFSRAENDGPAWAYVVKENVEVTGDMELDFDVASADRRVTFRTILPDGTEARLPVLTILDEEPYEKWNTSESNVGYIGYQGKLVNLEYMKTATSFMGNAAYIRGDNGFDGQITFDFQINEVSDRWCLMQNQCLLSETAFIQSLKESVGIPDGTVHNNPEDFRKLEYEIMHTPLSEKEPQEQFHSQVQATGLTNNGLITSTFGNFKSDHPDVYAEISRTGAAAELAPDACFTVTLLDIDKTIKGENFWDDKIIRNGVTSPFAHLENDNFRFINMGSANNNFTVLSDGTNHYDFSGLEQFSFDMNEKAIFGSGSPIAAFQNTAFYINEEKTKRVFTPGLKYLGNFGEERGSDLYCLRADMLVDNEPVLKDAAWDDLRKAMSQRASDDVNPGFLTLKFNNDNVSTDGIQGYNTTETGFSESGEDFCPPTVQALQMRNTAGSITDRFAAPSDGIIEFAGCDFNYLIEESRFSCDPVEKISVEYAPRGTGDFASIEASEIPELFQSPCFGYFWRVSLESVDRKSNDGWYDLRISMRDKAGNYQTQTLSPAFHIESLTGTEQVITDGIFSDGYVEVWSITGTSFGRIASREELKELPDGIYVLRGAGHTVKYIAR